MRAEQTKIWIELTKGELREEARKRELIGKFMETFGFLPDMLEWKTDCTQRILKAIAEEKPEAQTILGEKVEKIIFCLIEDTINLEPNTDWKFSSYSDVPYTVYKWSRKTKGVKAMVKIFVK